eukprot:804815-Pelagomonas_calceolata.AAC.17
MRNSPSHLRNRRHIGSRSCEFPSSEKSKREKRHANVLLQVSFDAQRPAAYLEWACRAWTCWPAPAARSRALPCPAAGNCRWPSPLGTVPPG